MPSYRHAIASMILHLDTLITHKPKRFFAKAIRKSMANQVAFEKIQLLKDKPEAQENPPDAERC